MNFRVKKTLFKKLASKGFKPKHVAEVGVYTPETSNIWDYIESGVRTTLVEPDPESIKKIKTRFGSHEHVTLHPVAAYDFNGTLDLVQRDASTFVSQLESSPAIVNDGYKVDDGDKFTVESVTFDRIDDGTIDLLSIDTEGSEWFVIKHMKSRPSVISIETHGAAYINPHIEQIRNWMQENGYVLYFKDNCDSVYVQPEAVAVSFSDKCRLCGRVMIITLRRIRKRALANH